MTQLLIPFPSPVSDPIETEGPICDPYAGWTRERMERSMRQGELWLEHPLLCDVARPRERVAVPPTPFRIQRERIR